MKREIIIEVERTRVIYNRKNKCLKWCPFCRAEVEILTLEEALEIAGVNLKNIYYFIAQGRIHLYRTPAEGPQVCLSSLLDVGGSLF